MTNTASNSRSNKFTLEKDHSLYSLCSQQKIINFDELSLLKRNADIAVKEQGREYYEYPTGKKKAQPLTKEQIAQAKQYFLNKPERFKGQNIRDYTMFIFSLNTAFRGGDVIHLRWGNMIDKNYNILSECCIREQKTKKDATTPITQSMKEALIMYMNSFGIENINLKNPIFPSRNRDKYGNQKPLDLSNYWRKYQGLREELKIDFPMGTHTPRRTFGAIHYEIDPTDSTLSFLKRKYNHSSESITNRYIGNQKKQDDSRIIAVDL
jgi:integrase